MVECPTEVGAHCAFHIIIDTTLDKNEGLLSGAEGTRGREGRDSQHHDLNRKCWGRDMQK